MGSAGGVDAVDYEEVVILKKSDLLGIATCSEDSQGKGRSVGGG